MLIHLLLRGRGPEGFRWKAVLFRILLAVSVFAALYLSGLREHVTISSIREHVENLGAWGPALLLMIYSIRDLLRVPAWALCFISVSAFGAVSGTALAYAGVNLSVNVTFGLIRLVLGKSVVPRHRFESNRWIRLIAQKPIVAIILARQVFYASSFLNFGLAATRTSYRHFFIGSLIGLMPPTLLVGAVSHWFWVTE